MPDIVFNLGNWLAMTGWFVLFAGLLVRRFRARAVDLARLMAAVVLGATYIGLLIAGRDAFSEGGYASLAQVKALFANDFALVAGWVHYLAFDLFVAAWIVEDGDRRKVNSWVILPCLGLTFMFGPAGLLLYFVSRPFASKAA